MNTHLSSFDIQASIIRWVLNHDPVQRPTSQELLQSHYLPPPQLEETELSEVYLPLYPERKES